MKRITNLFAALLLHVPALMAAAGGADSTHVRLSRFDMIVDERAANVRVRMEVAVEDYRVRADREMILTPILIADDASDSLLLDPVVIAGRNRWYYYQRSGMTAADGTPVYRAGKTGTARIDTEFPLRPWMAHSALEMRVETANCCDTPQRLEGPSPSGNVPLAHIDTERPVLNLDYVYAPPVDAAPVVRSIEGSAFVTFAVNRTELREDFMENRKELDKIIGSIDYVRRDSDAIITHVHVKGFASPEGTYENNIRLATGRTETLRRYVRDLYSFHDTIVTSAYEPEDWAGLRAYVADSAGIEIRNRNEILDIIDGNLGFDNKNLAIQTRFPEDYAVLLGEVYPWLRHSDYKVTYAIRQYTSLEEIQSAYRTDPTRLRTVDFYTLARSYAEGSEEYCEVFETAVGVYPDDPMLNLNAANIEMKRGEYDKAQSHLLKAGNTPQAYYARGILAMRRMDYDEAIRNFGCAGEGGMQGMDEVIEQVGSIRDYYPVSYRIRPAGE